MTTTRQIGNFQLRDELFEQVKEHMQTALAIEVTDQIADNFLAKHPQLLGCIVGFDEVDTTDRHNLWDAIKGTFPASQLKAA